MKHVSSRPFSPCFVNKFHETFKFYILQIVANYCVAYATI